jgi:hypothetical protein
MRVSVVCKSCGQQIPVVGDPARAAVACPNCQAVCTPPTNGAITATAPAPAVADDDDGKPYAMDQPDDPVGDEMDMPSIALQTAEPVKYQWEASPALHTRLSGFIAYEIGLLGVGVLLLLVEDWSWQGVVVFEVVFSALAAFALGTFDRVDLKRSHRGRIALSKTWRVCFIELTPTNFARRDYEAVSTTVESERVLFDWLMLVWLLALGILPGVLWFFFVFIKPVYQVALTKDHGRPALILYQGRDEALTNAIAKTISEVCRYRWRGAF